MQRIQFQLYQAGPGGMPGAMISASGGVAYVAESGTTGKETLTEKDGSALANPLALTNGGASFYVADSVVDVDLYIACPGGQFAVARDVKPGIREIVVDLNQVHQCMVIPFDQADFDANDETDTGFDEPASGAALMLPNPAVRVTTLDDSETLDVGTDSGDSGDADGFLAAVSLGTAALVKGTVLNGSNTMGALFEVQDSANSGDIAPEARVSGGKSITITSSAGSDTGKGFIYLPYLLCN